MDGKGKKTIASLDSKVRNLELSLTNERDQHNSEIHMLNALIQEKDAMIRKMKKELEDRPTTELVDEMRQQLTVLLVTISEKKSLLEAAQERITELKEEIIDRENLITKIEAEIEEALIQIHGDEFMQEINSSIVPVIPVPRKTKLTFFGTNEANYDLDDLLEATAEVLGKGTFGATYKTILESGSTLVVKRIKQVKLPEQEFRDGIIKLSELTHDNIMPLRAYYFSNDEKLLVYDFLPTGSLSETLHGARRAPLSWQTRANIALTSARGISHIHSLGPFSAHGNIKSSNILLSTNSDASVSDTGLFFLATPVPSRRFSTGYWAPEVTDPTKPSQKADVYSFGVLLLELLTGRAPSPHGLDLVKWVQSELQHGWVERVLDEDLMRDPSVVEEDLVEFLQLAIDCTESFPEMRPFMHVVDARIEAIFEFKNRE